MTADLHLEVLRYTLEKDMQRRCMSDTYTTNWYDIDSASTSVVSAAHGISTLPK